MNYFAAIGTALASLVPPIIDQVIDYFTDEEEPKESRSKLTEKDIAYIQGRYEYWMSHDKFIDSTTYLSNQEQFTQYVNDVLGTKVSKTTVMRAAKKGK